MTAISELNTGPFEGAFGGTVIDIRDRSIHDGQHGQNAYQDVTISDGTETNDEIVVTLVNRRALEDWAMGKILNVEVPSGQQNVQCTISDEGKYGWKARCKKGAKTTIGDKEIPYERPGQDGGGSRGNSRGGSGGGQQQTTTVLAEDDLMSHLMAAQDHAIQFARRAAGQLKIEVTDLPAGLQVTANQIVMACRDQGIVLKGKDPLGPGQTESQEPPADIDDDDIPF